MAEFLCEHALHLRQRITTIRPVCLNARTDDVERTV